MKTSELTAKATYAYSERPSYGSTYPALVLEKVLWTEKDAWYRDDEGKRVSRRHLVRAEKGDRAGTKSGWGRDFKKTGIPVLKLDLSDWHFGVDNEQPTRITDTAPELLVKGAEQLKLMELVDSGESVFGQDEEGQSFRKTKTKVVAHTADGGEITVTVELELVRPQTLLLIWHEHVEAAERGRKARAEHVQKQNEKKAASDTMARDIASRLDALLGADKSHTHGGERYDAYRRDAYHGGTTYLVDQDLLLKLLALAEKGANQ